MQDRNGSSSKLKVKKLLKIKGSSSFTAALLAIALGLIFGFIIMLFASPANSLPGFLPF